MKRDKRSVCRGDCPIDWASLTTVEKLALASVQLRWDEEEGRLMTLDQLPVLFPKYDDFT